MQRRTRIYPGRPAFSRKPGNTSGPVSAHQYAVGQTVRYMARPAGLASRALDKSMFAATFVITQSLPTAGTELQYRVKNTVTGHERVAAEGEIAPADND